LFLIVFSGLKDEMLEESENLPDPNVIAADIVEDLEAALK
jgi:type I restriction enzyme M protein